VKRPVSSDGAKSQWHLFTALFFLDKFIVLRKYYAFANLFKAKIIRT
jgi:hypothetical protein